LPFTNETTPFFPPETDDSLGWPQIIGIAAGALVVVAGVCSAVRPVREKVKSSCKSIWYKTTSCFRKPDQKVMPDRENEDNGDKGYMEDKGYTGAVDAGSIEVSVLELSTLPHSQREGVSITRSSLIPSEMRGGGEELERNFAYPTEGPLTMMSRMRAEGDIFESPAIPVDILADMLLTRRPASVSPQGIQMDPSLPIPAEPTTSYIAEHVHIMGASGWENDLPEAAATK
jgi:hypothetical protein